MPTIDIRMRCAVRASRAACSRWRACSTPRRPRLVARWTTTSAPLTAAATPSPMVRSPVNQVISAESAEKPGESDVPAAALPTEDSDVVSGSGEAVDGGAAEGAGAAGDEDGWH